MSVSSTSSSSSSSEDLSVRPNPPPLTSAQRTVYKKLDRLRMASSALMIAALVMVAVTAVLIGLTQARYIPPVLPLYAFCATVPFLAASIIVDCCLRSIARENHIDPVDYFRVRQPPPIRPKKPKTEKKADSD